MSAWVALVLAGLGCFGMRFGVVTFVDRRPLPTWFERASTFVVPGALAGLCASLLVVPVVTGGVGPSVVVAAITTAAVARRHGSTTALAWGMAVLWISGFVG